jgi:hypothetical protein
VAYVCHGVNGEAEHSRQSHHTENGSNLNRMLGVQVVRVSVAPRFSGPGGIASEHTGWDTRRVKADGKEGERRHLLPSHVLLPPRVSTGCDERKAHSPKLILSVRGCLKLDISVKSSENGEMESRGLCRRERGLSCAVRALVRHGTHARPRAARARGTR